MWLIGKKAKKDEKKDALDADEDEEEEKKEIPADAGLGTKIEMIQAELTKINGSLESFKEMRKSMTERFSMVNEQIGEMRGVVTDAQRSVGMIEVKATKAADLVESVQPDKLMIQIQREDGKLEGLRGVLEAKEEMLKNTMDQVKKLRDQMILFRGVEQVIKLNEEVKDELMNVKRVTAEVERHADRVENVFIEAQKSFEAYHSFSDKLEDMRADIKELQQKIDKLEVAIATFVKKKEFDEKLERIEKSDKQARSALSEIEGYYKKIEDRFKQLETRLRADFEFKLQKAEILSRAFEDLLKENPIFADGLRLNDYVKHNLGMSTSDIKDSMRNISEQKAIASQASAEAAGADKPTEGAAVEQPAQQAGQAGAAPAVDPKVVEGMTAVKK